MDKDFFSHLENTFQDNYIEGIPTVFSLNESNEIDFLGLQLFGRSNFFYYLDFAKLFLHFFIIFYIFKNTQELDFFASIVIYFFILLVLFLFSMSELNEAKKRKHFQSKLTTFVLGLAVPLYTLTFKPKKIFQDYFYEYKKTLSELKIEKHHSKINKHSDTFLNA